MAEHEVTQSLTHEVEQLNDRQEELSKQLCQPPQRRSRMRTYEVEGRWELAQWEVQEVEL